MKAYLVPGRAHEVIEVDVHAMTDRRVWLADGTIMPRVNTYHGYYPTRGQAVAALRQRLQAHEKDSKAVAARCKQLLEGLT